MLTITFLAQVLFKKKQKSNASIMQQTLKTKVWFLAASYEYYFTGGYAFWKNCTFYFKM